MNPSHTIDLSVILEPLMLERLEAEAVAMERPIAQVVRDALEHYMEWLDEDDDTSDDEILTSLQRALLDVKEGRTQPIDTLFDELNARYPESQHDPG